MSVVKVGIIGAWFFDDHGLNLSLKKWLPKTTCTSLENHGSFSSAKVGKHGSLFLARPTNPSEPF